MCGLADYQGERDLVPLLRLGLNRHGLDLGDLSVRATLRATDARFVLLLDGLNELERGYQQDGLGAIHRHLDDYPRHTVHLTCRTADFDRAAGSPSCCPRTTQLWDVQPLADDIDHWEDTEGKSDVRDYLRRIWATSGASDSTSACTADDRLQRLATIPLFLWMFQETAGDCTANCPPNRGELLQALRRPRAHPGPCAHGTARPAPNAAWKRWPGTCRTRACWTWTRIR